MPTITRLTATRRSTPSRPWSNYQTIYEFKDNLDLDQGRAHDQDRRCHYSYEIKFEPTNTNVFGGFNFDGALHAA